MFDTIVVGLIVTGAVAYIIYRYAVKKSGGCSCGCGDGCGDGRGGGMKSSQSRGCEAASKQAGACGCGGGSMPAHSCGCRK